MKKVIIQADRLIDGLGGPPQTGMALVVEGGVISSIVPAANLEYDADSSQVLHFPGATLLPGLIDCHTHTNMAGQGAFRRGGHRLTGTI